MPGHTHTLDKFWESTVSQSSLAGNARPHSHTGHILREHCQPIQFGRKCQATLTPWTHFERPLSASPLWKKLPGHTHFLDTFWESTVSQSSLKGNARPHSQTGHILREHCQPIQFGRKCQATLTGWTHFERALSASPVWKEMPGHTHLLNTFWESTVSQSTLAGNARPHSHTGHILRALSASPLWQKMPGHTHFLDTFWESTVSQSTLKGNARPHSQPGHIWESTVSQSTLKGNAKPHSPPEHILREHCQPVHFGRKYQATLTHWTHFERALSASPLWQEMPGHTHTLDTFWESTVSQSTLAGNARPHSQPGHILREHCQPVHFERKCQATLTPWTHFERALSASPVWQEMPGHTHTLDTFWESTVSQSTLAENARPHSQPGHILREHCQPVQFERKCQATLTAWTHFERALSASPLWQKMPGHTHTLDTFWESTVSQSTLKGNARPHSPPEHILREHCQPVHFGRKYQATLTYWTHFERALSASPLWQKMPGHTHSLDTFWESTVSQSSLKGNARPYSPPGHILRKHCQPVQFGRKCQATLTFWTHFERALSASPLWKKLPGHTHSLDTFWESTVSQSTLAENARPHSHPGHILREHCHPVHFGRKCQATLTFWTHFERALSASPLWQEMPWLTTWLCFEPCFTLNT